MAHATQDRKVGVVCVSVCVIIKEPFLELLETGRMTPMNVECALNDAGNRMQELLYDA